MSDPSIWTRNRDLLISVVLISIGAILSATGFVEITSFPKNIAGAIFTVIIGATMTLLTILEVYGNFVENAKEKGKLDPIKKTFKIPVLVAVIGFVIAILASTFAINIGSYSSMIPIFTLEEWLSLLMSGLLLYAVIAFAHTFSFIFRVVTNPNTGSNNGHGGQEGESSDGDETTGDSPAKPDTEVHKA